MMGWIGIQLGTTPLVTWEVVEVVWAVGAPMFGAGVAPVVPWGGPPAGFGGAGLEAVEDAMLLSSSFGSSTSSIGLDHSAIELCSEMSTNEEGVPGLVPEGAQDGVDEIFTRGGLES